MIADTNNVCTWCGLFIPFRAGILLTIVYPDSVLNIKNADMVDDNLDCCKSIDKSFYFCKYYYGMIVERKIP